MNGNQVDYDKWRSVFEYLQYLVSYRVDLINDLRMFRAAFAN